MQLQILLIIAQCRSINLIQYYYLLFFYCPFITKTWEMSTWMINSKTNMLWATSIAIGATNCCGSLSMSASWMPKYFGNWRRETLLQNSAAVLLISQLSCCSLVISDGCLTNTLGLVALKWKDMCLLSPQGVMWKNKSSSLKL